MNCKKTNCEHCPVCKIADHEIIEDCKYFVSKDDKYITTSDNKYKEITMFDEGIKTENEIVENYLKKDKLKE